MPSELTRIHDDIETLIEDDHDDPAALAAVIADRVVGPLLAELAEIKRVTEPPTKKEMPTDPAELKELWEFINQQGRWQWHMAHKFGNQVERLRAELATYRAAAQSTDLEGDARDHFADLADWETPNGETPEWLVDAVMGFVAPHVCAASAAEHARDQAEAERDAAHAAIARVRRMAQVWIDIRPTYPTATGEGHAIAEAGRQVIAALDASTAPETADHGHDHANSQGSEHGAAESRPVSVASPGNDGFRYEPVEQDTPEPDVIEMTAGEWNTALKATLDDIGVTWEQLAEQAKTGDFSSLRARKLWLTAGPQGFLNTPESPQEDV